jgi:hypothetical protein
MHRVPSLTTEHLSIFCDVKFPPATSRPGSSEVSQKRLDMRALLNYSGVYVYVTPSRHELF